MQLTRENTLPGATSGLEVVIELPTYLAHLRLGTGVEAIPEGEALEAEAHRFERRVQAACGWLHLLGYTDTMLTCTTPDSLPLVQVLKRFQADAGLTANGQLDDTSWSALLKLVGFDSETDVLAFHHGRTAKAVSRPRPALQRAILLRLNVLQHTTLLPHTDITVAQLDAAIRQGLTSFSYTLAQLGVSAAARRSRLRVERWLFDHDAQLEVLLQWVRARGASDFHTLRSTPVWDAIHGVARVELYLRDHDVGDLDDTELSGAFWRALQTERSLRQLQSAKRNHRLSVELLEAWVEDQGSTADAADLSSQHAHTVLHTALARLHAGHVEGEWQRLTDRRFRLWEGFRRAVKWVGQAIARGVDWLVTQVARPLGHGLTQLVRWLFRSACQVVTAVQDAALAFRRFVTGPLHSPAGVTRVYPDFDVDTWVSTPHEAPVHTQWVQQTLRGFLVAVRVLLWVGDLLLLAITGGWTWFRVLRGLLTLFRDLKRRGAELELLAEAPVPALHLASLSSSTPLA